MTLQNSVILIRNNGMGQAEPDLQLTLIQKYLDLLLAGGDLPSAICFYTQGVKLVANGSTLLDKLKALEEEGVRLIICSTCLGYYGLANSVRVGIVGGMGDILEAQARADKVISL